MISMSYENEIVRFGTFYEFIRLTFSSFCGCSWKLSILLAFCTFPGLFLPDISLGVTDIPHYRINVFYDHDKKLLAGKMQVRFNPDVYPPHELLFALPMNRFRMPDKRGLRKHRVIPVFALNRYQDEKEDPSFPSGFSPGSINILSVKDSQGKKLVYSLEANPELETGYSTLHGLLRVSFPANLRQRVLTIEFNTLLPHNTREGGINGSMITSLWHPQLLVYGRGGWLKDGMSPAPGTYAVTWSASREGVLITTTAHHTQVSADQQLSLPVTPFPVKSFPLIFSPSYLKFKPSDAKDVPDSPGPSDASQDSETDVETFYFSGYERRAGLIHRWGRDYLRFVRNKYKLHSPWKTVRVVAVEAEYEQVSVINNLVLVPLPNFKRSSILDRRVLGFLSRGFGQLWFGESVWNNRDRELWLNLGLPAFLGLRFYQHEFGVDAGIFNFPDWMNPRYREHFFEDIALGIPENMSYPILSSFREVKEYREYLKSVTYKSALVLSMLEYLVGPLAFRKGLQRFHQQFRQRAAGAAEFKKVINDAYHSDGAAYAENNGFPSYHDLEWFFEQWFATTTGLDYAVGELQTKQGADGGFYTAVEVLKQGEAWMPVEVLLQFEDGSLKRGVVGGRDTHEIVEFISASKPKSVSLDPEEKLLESNRINNHSISFHRVRFGFDWKKRREHLWLLVPGVASNAIDGNSYGVGIRHSFTDYRIYAMPGYGTKNERFLYLLEFDHEKLGFEGLSAGFSLREQAGVRSEGIRLNYASPEYTSRILYSFGTSFSRETMFVARKGAVEGDTRETGNSNVFVFQHSGKLPLSNYYHLDWSLSSEQPSLELNRSSLK